MHIHVEEAYALFEALTVIPVLRGAPRGAKAEPVVLYRRESSGSVAIPRHFGIERFGRASPGLRPPVQWVAPGRRWHFEGNLTPQQGAAVAACKAAYDHHNGGVLEMYCGGGDLHSRLRHPLVTALGTVGG